MILLCQTRLGEVFAHIGPNPCGVEIEIRGVETKELLDKFTITNDQFVSIVTAWVARRVQALVGDDEPAVQREVTGHFLTLIGKESLHLNWLDGKGGVS